MKIFKRHKFGLIAVLIFILFFKLIPVDLYNFSPAIISIIGAFLLAFFLVLYLFRYSSIKEFIKIITGRKKDPKRTFIGESFFIAISLIVFGMFFILNQSENEERELVKNGIVTKAVVIDKSTVSVTRRLRKHNVYYLKLSFEDNNRNNQTINEDVSSDLFRMTKKGDMVRIIYSRMNPNIIEIK